MLQSVLCSSVNLLSTNYSRRLITNRSLVMVVGVDEVSDKAHLLQIFCCIFSMTVFVEFSNYGYLVCLICFLTFTFSTLVCEFEQLMLC